MTAFTEILGKVGGMTAGLIAEQSSDEDAIVVASALCESASLIFKHLGGPQFAAAQFYSMADRLAAEDAQMPPPG